MLRIKTLLTKHRPSGLVTGFLAFFIIAYVIITKLDATDRLQVKESQATDEDDSTPPVAKVIRTNKNIIPMHILAEFAQDAENVQSRNYDFYDEALNGTDYSIDKHRIHIPNNVADRIMTHSIKNNAAGRRTKEHTVRSKQAAEKENHVQIKHSNSGGIWQAQYADKKKEIQHKKSLAQGGPSALYAHKHSGHPLVHFFDALSESKAKMDSIKNNKCVQLKTLHGASPICIHNPADDEIISGKISSQGNWEANYLYITGSVLTQNPYLEVIDLGCNIGVYTILSAKLGHKVMAIDPNKVNLRLLTKSLNMGGLANKVRLVWNAISNVRENVTLFDIIGNIGGSFIETADETDMNDKTLDDDHRAFAITLDDLTEFFKGKQVFLKMDIETYELKALKGGHMFFSQVHVRFVLMEWIYHREYDTGKEIIAFMKKYGLLPHINAHTNTKLDPQYYRSWPDNILWIKY